MSTATLTDALTFITNADNSDLERILDAYNARRKALAAVTAAQVRAGAVVTLDGLSPKYLNGLRGRVETVNRTRADVLLNKNSTAILRATGGRFHVDPETDTHVLPGVPLTCCHIVDDAAEA